MLLRTEGLTKDFIGLRAVDEVSIELRQGELVGLIGPNGSGKTTLFNCLTGFLEPTKGRVFFKDEEITNLPPHEVTLKGLTRTFQQIHVFQDLTVTENLLLALQQHQGERILPSILNMPTIRRLERESREKALEMLEFGDLIHLRDEKAGNLSYGQQKILSFLTTLMPSPSLILLDEPTAAVNPTLINRFMDQIRELHQNGLSFLIIEHNMEFIMQIAERIIVLNYGELISEGTGDQVRNDPAVMEAYFGV